MDSQSAITRPGPNTTRGNPSYGGYEYQIAVIVWTALDLLLVKSATDALTIEPRCHEDIQADLKVDPDVASTQMCAVLRSYDFILQAKSRSRGPWTANLIAKILAPRPTKSKRPGPAPRKSPLELLAENPDRRYMFVTNEGLHTSLYPYRADTLLDWPDTNTLPPHTSQHVDKDDRAAIAGRLALCPGVSREILQARIQNILASHGHVPLAEHRACIRDLEDEVRRRMLGHAAGRWTRTELISILTRHHGSLMPTRVMDYYVRPASFAAIRQTLATHHAVVIAGPPGTGKTLTAEVLEEMLRQSPIAFSVIGEEHGPGYVRAQLQRTDPVLFHLRDPWGGNQLMSGADRWTNELPKLLGHRGPNRKFLITSRSDVLHSAGSHLEQQLRPHIVNLETEHYGRARLAQIYDRRRSDLSQQLAARALDYRERALQVLQRPFEVDRFFVALCREDPAAPRSAETLIAESQIEAISLVVTGQVCARSRGVECAAFLWGLLAARGSVAQQIIPKLRRQLRQLDPSLQLEVEDLVDFLIAGRNLRRDGATLALYHPRVEDGLRAAIQTQPAATEIVLSRLCDVLLTSHGDWGADTVLRLLRAAGELTHIEVEPVSSARKPLDDLLLANVFNAEGYEVEHALRDLATYGADDSGPTLFAEALSGRHQSEMAYFPGTWEAPELSESAWGSLLADPSIPELTRQFVTHVLPTTRIQYADDLQVFLALLCPVLRNTYWKALRTVVDGPHQCGNVETLVCAACGTDPFELDRAVELFAKALARGEDTREQSRDKIDRANELELDEWESELIDDQLAATVAESASKGLRAVIRIRRKQDGVTWILTHPHRSRLIPALADVLDEDSEPRAAELRVLIQGSQDGWQRDMAWYVAGRHWDSSLEDLYVPELIRADLTPAATRQALVQIASSRIPDDTKAALAELSRLTVGATTVRRLELVYDVATTDRESDFEQVKQSRLAPLIRASTLVATYEGTLHELAQALIATFQQRPADEIASRLTEDSKRHLEILMPDLPEHLAAMFLGVAATLGVDPAPTIRRLLSTNNAENAAAVIQQLDRVASPDTKSTLIDMAIQHSHYSVRCAVLTYLAASGTASDHTAVLSMSKDCSAAVRLAVAEQMAERRWPEAIGALVDLLRDTRDFGSGDFPLPQRSPVYEVAQAAATALGSYDDLPEFAVTALIEQISNAQYRDPAVACIALKALTRCTDSRMTAVLLEALQKSTLEDASDVRPLAETAAWELLERVQAGTASLQPHEYDRLVQAACTDPPEVAAPVLLTLQQLSTPAALRLVDDLQHAGKPERAELLLVAAAVDGKLSDEPGDPPLRLLARLARAQSAPLTQPEHVLLQTWRAALDTKEDVAKVTAQLADQLLRPDIP